MDLVKIFEPLWIVVDKIGSNRECGGNNFRSEEIRLNNASAITPIIKVRRRVVQAKY